MNTRQFNLIVGKKGILQNSPILKGKQFQSDSTMLHTEERNE